MSLLKGFGETDVGLKRDNNQDSYLVDHELGVYIVADGMGGHLGGEVASKLAVQTIRKVISENIQSTNPLGPYEVLQKAYTEASRCIFEKSEEEPKLKGMGTTAVTVYCKEDTIYIANVGDSRCYLIQPPYIWQMTEDHSLLNEQIRAGLVKPEKAAMFAAKNVITRSVGFEMEVTADILERELKGGDLFLLCSDGLSGLVGDNRIGDVCNSLSFDEVVPRLINEAKRNGGDDNVTVVFLKGQVSS